MDVVKGEGEADSWAERIRWIAKRYAHGSQRQVGRDIGVEGQTVNGWARGIAQPSGANLEALLRKYPRLNPHYLLTGEGPRERGERPIATPTEAQRALEEIAAVVDQVRATSRASAEHLAGMAEDSRRLDEHLKGSGPPEESEDRRQSGP